MNARRALVIAAASACVLGGAGCTLAPDKAAPLVAAPPPAGQAAPARAERIAEALVQAAAAEQAGDAAALQQAARRLERLGAAPQSPADQESMARWLARLPEDPAPLRGRALGPAYRSGTLDPGAASELNQTFFGGRSAQIVVRARRGAGLRLVVQDQASRQVCKAESDPVTCRWVPLYTQRHVIRIVNTGPDVSEFYIVFD